MVGAKVYQIDYLLDKYEIPRRTLSVANRKYSVNHSYFKQIDDCEKAYWLGFLYADGFVTAGNYVGLSLAVTDKKHVENSEKLSGRHIQFTYIKQMDMPIPNTQG